MKKLIVVIVLSNILVFSQTSKEEKLEWIKSRGDIKVTEIDTDLLRIEYPDGKVLLKNIGDYHPPTTQNQQPTYDSTIIDLLNVDTLLYYHKYKFWQDVTVSQGPVSIVVVDDVDNDKLTELYGYQRGYETGSSALPLRVLELNSASKEFKVAHTYHDTIIIAKDIYDVDKDGQKQLFAVSKFGGSWGELYKKSHPDSLAIVEESSYYGVTQMNDFMFTNLDNNSITDFLYYTLVGNDTVNGGGSTVIGQYNQFTNLLDSLHSFNVSDTWGAGYSVSDVDEDGFPEIVIGTLHGYVRIIEYQPGEGYQYVWDGQVETFHAYVHTATKDIDRNGKREFWVGGDAFYNGYPITRYTCFEATGNNEYVAVARIDLLGIFSFSAYNAFAIDVDKDGIEELGICVDQHFLLLKFKGSPDHHSYDIYYIKKNEIDLMGENSDYFGVTMYDLLDDGTPEILITLRHVIISPPNYPRREFTQIYTPDDIVLAEEEMELPDRSHLYQNYPNPFNSLTKIKFRTPNTVLVKVKVFNILGKEIKLLLDKELPAGEYSVDWDGTDIKGNIVNSGVYFVTIEAKNFQKTIKAILLK